jgi:1-aminocyclopropane-1-carboxylate deaminase
MLYSTEKSILEKLSFPILDEKNIELFVKRDDLIDSEVSGNKWRKLKYNIEQALSKKNDTIITFGGAFSNHLVATAAACKLVGIRCIGIVRGEELNSNSNDTLRRCESYGMELKFVPRNEYALRNDSLYLKDIHLEHENAFIVPEGGANFYGMIGCQDIIKEIDKEFDHVFIAQGTTTTSCGVLISLPSESKLHVVPVLKGFDSISEMRSLLNYTLFDEELTEELLSRVQVHCDAHFGGYGKYDLELLNFIKQFYQENSIKLDPIYTGKVMFELIKNIIEDKLNNSKVLFIHTGGLQGIEGVEKKQGYSLFT